MNTKSTIKKLWGYFILF